MSDSLESALCNLCGADDAETLATRARWGQTMRNVVCRRCGLVYANPRLRRVELDRFYQDRIYREYQTADGTFAPRLLDSSRQQARQTIDAFVTRCGVALRGITLLEIGCGLGDFLALARDAGALVQGIDMEGAYADYASSVHGLSVIRNHVEATSAPPVDIIAMFHVLEHLEDPAATLVSLRDRLRAGGRLLIEVPSILAPWPMPPEEFLRIEHLYNFSYKTLVQLLRKTGYRVVAHDDDPYLLRIVAEPAPPSPVDLASLRNEAQAVRRHLRTWRIRERLLRPYYALRRRLDGRAAQPSP